MPRPGPRRPYVALRLSQQGLDLIDEWAKAETATETKPEGNRSEMIRKLLGEAIAARQKKAQR